MWRNMLRGMAANSVCPLEYYQNLEIPSDKLENDISRFVCETVEALPWYFRLSLKMMAATLNLLCCVSTGRKFGCLARERRAVWLRRMKIVPLFPTLNKFVRAMALMNLFDHPSNISTIEE